VVGLFTQVDRLLGQPARYPLSANLVAAVLAVTEDILALCGNTTYSSWRPSQTWGVVLTRPKWPVGGMG
jgi:hypothetical protein